MRGTDLPRGESATLFDHLETQAFQRFNVDLRHGTEPVLPTLLS
jgi:hypothetical protein